MAKAFAAALLGSASAWDLPKDCRNHTLSRDGGDLVATSYHIHYTTDKQAARSDMARFYEAFVAHFSDHFPSQRGCPFGPNYGAYKSDLFPAKTICSLEGPLEFELQSKSGAEVSVTGNPWGGLYQRAFFVPINLVDEAWEWAKANRGKLDVVYHPNSGCMYDDHGPRARWSGTEHTILRLQFPCNMPGTGCLDQDYPGPPSCGCPDGRIDDSPQNSCKNCVVIGVLPPEPASAAIV